MSSIPNPPAYGPYDGLFWNYDLSNLGNCKDVKIWAFLTVSFNEGLGTKLIIYPVSALTGNTIIDANYIATLGGHPGVGFTLTNMAFQLEINGILNSIVIYPGMNITINTGLPAPCDCINIFFDTTHKTIYVGQGNC